MYYYVFASTGRYITTLRYAGAAWRALRMACAMYGPNVYIERV